jgi:magnesium transporter
MRTPTAELLAPDVHQMVSEQRWREVRETLEALEPADIADVVDTIEPAEDAALAFRMLPRATAAVVFAYLVPEKQEALLELLGDERAARLIEAMDPDDRAAVLDELPVEVTGPLLRKLSPENRRVTQAILGYPVESVGRLMTPKYVRLKPDWTIQHALDHIRKHGRDAETVAWVFIVDDHEKLLDDVRIRDVLIAEPDSMVLDLMDHEFVALGATDDREEAVRVMNRYDRTALPVIDSLGNLVGIVTFDDVADVAEKEFTEDVQKLGGMAALEEPYLTASLREMVRKRGPWLALLFLMQTGTIAVMGFFESQLAAAVVLATFIPLIISCGGNTGSQASSMLVRAIALGQVSIREWWTVAKKELVAGLVLGTILGVQATIIVMAMHILGVLDALPTTHAAMLAFTVGTAVVGIVMWGTLVGSLLPLVLHRLGFDPAASSAPLIATLMDVSGLTIFFTVAMLFLRTTVLAG